RPGPSRRRRIRAVRPAERGVPREVRLSVHHRGPPPRQAADPRGVRDSPREHRSSGNGNRARPSLRDRAPSPGGPDRRAMSPVRRTPGLDPPGARPPAGLGIEPARPAADGPARPIKPVTPNADGRVDAPLLGPTEMAVGCYELVFHVGAYFRAAGGAQAEPPFL